MVQKNIKKTNFEDLTATKFKSFLGNPKKYTTLFLKGKSRMFVINILSIGHHKKSVPRLCRQRQIKTKTKKIKPKFLEERVKAN